MRSVLEIWLSQFLRKYIKSRENISFFYCFLLIRITMIPNYVKIENVRNSDIVHKPSRIFKNDRNSYKISTHSMLNNVQ